MANLARELMLDVIPNYPYVTIVRPIQDNDICYQGLMVTEDTSYNVGTFSTSERLAGFVLHTVDNTGTGHAAARAGFDVQIIVGGPIRYYISGTTRADIGKAVFCGADDNSLSLNPRARGYVGKIIANDGSGLCTIMLDPERMGRDNWETYFDLADDAEVALPDAQAARVILQGGGEYAEYSVSTAGAVTGVSTSATASDAKPLCGCYTLNKPAAATTSAKATQYDLTGGNGSLAGIVQPDVPRNVVINFTDADTGITAFTVTVNGTDASGAAQSEEFVFAGGLEQNGVKAFATISSIVLTNLAGAGAGDTLDIGHGVIYGVPINGGASFSVKKLAVDGADDIIAAQSATYNTFTPTTAANGTKCITVWYTYTRTTTPTVSVTGGQAGSTNTAATDSDGNLCLYDGGTAAMVKNRLGATKRIHCQYWGAPTA